MIYALLAYLRESIGRVLRAAFHWLTKPEDPNDKMLNLVTRIGLILAVVGALPLALLLSWVLSSDSSDSQTQETTSTQVLSPATSMATSSSSLPTTTSSTSAPSTTSSTPSETEDLEVVEVEYSNEVTVSMGAVFDGSDRVPDEEAQLYGGPKPILPIVVTFRNSTDVPLLINNLVVEVRDEALLPWCDSLLGGSIAISYNYGFIYESSNADFPQSVVSSENFSVEPRSADALSITIGPDLVSAVATSAFLFTVFAETPDTERLELLSGIGVDVRMLDSDALVAYSLEDLGPGAAGNQDALTCLRNGLDVIDKIESEWSPAEVDVVHPSFFEFKMYYEDLMAAIG